MFLHDSRLGCLSVSVALSKLLLPLPRALASTIVPPDLREPLQNSSRNASTSIQWEKDGPLPLISDSVFSLIILIYVGVIFVFMFFSFCWKEPQPPAPDPAHKNIPMITSLLEEMERKEAALSKEPLVDISEALEDESNNPHTSSASSSVSLRGTLPPKGTEMTLMKPEIISHHISETPPTPEGARSHPSGVSGGEDATCV